TPPLRPRADPPRSSRARWPRLQCRSGLARYALRPLAARPLRLTEFRRDEPTELALPAEGLRQRGEIPARERIQDSVCDLRGVDPHAGDRSTVRREARTRVRNAH